MTLTECRALAIFDVIRLEKPNSYIFGTITAITTRGVKIRWDTGLHKGKEGFYPWIHAFSSQWWAKRIVRGEGFI